MKQYKVVKIKGKRLVPKIDNWHKNAAKEMRDKYGLPFSLEDIIESWGEWSEMMCAGWLCDSSEDIEKVFGVKLKRIK